MLFFVISGRERTNLNDIAYLIFHNFYCSLTLNKF